MGYLAKNWVYTFNKHPEKINYQIYSRANKWLSPFRWKGKNVVNGPDTMEINHNHFWNWVSSFKPDVILFQDQNIYGPSKMQEETQKLRKLGIKLINYPDWIIVCNNDITFSNNNFFSELEKIDIKEYPIIGPNIINSKGKKLNPFMLNPLSKLEKIVIFSPPMEQIERSKRSFFFIRSTIQYYRNERYTGHIISSAFPFSPCTTIWRANGTVTAENGKKH